MLSASEIASMTATVAGSLDVSVTGRRANPVTDIYGHISTSGGYTATGPFNVNVIKPNATQLSAYAEVIAAQKTQMIRFMPGDIREGDEILFNGVYWKMHAIEDAESYTFANEALLVVVQ